MYYFQILSLIFLCLDYRDGLTCSFRRGGPSCPGNLICCSGQVTEYADDRSDDKLVMDGIDSASDTYDLPSFPSFSMIPLETFTEDPLENPFLAASSLQTKLDPLGFHQRTRRRHSGPESNRGGEGRGFFL